ncbi:hypothetical protein ACLOJK_010399 [Asimina triloba]
MKLEKSCLDLILVPSGLAVMFAYHLHLLYRVLRHPASTVIGYENHNKMVWVERMLQGGSSNRGVAIDVISSNVSASTYLASLSITLSSLIGTWVGSSSSKVFMEAVIYGDKSPSTSSVKFITLLGFFLVAFTSFVQSARYFLHANFLMTIPDSDVPVSYVQREVIRGGNFWCLGLRALYFATPLLLWIFGPIPMFACSVSIVVALNFLDSNSIPLHNYPILRQGDKRRQNGQRNSEPMLIQHISTQSSNVK